MTKSLWRLFFKKQKKTSWMESAFNETYILVLLDEKFVNLSNTSREDLSSNPHGMPSISLPYGLWCSSCSTLTDWAVQPAVLFLLKEIERNPFQ